MQAVLYGKGSMHVPQLRCIYSVMERVEGLPFEIIRNDITRMQVDAIVNAANPSLLGGGGVDGAIHRAAGPQLLEECKGLNGCSTGQAKITKGYRLPAKYVIHTVGPVWTGGGCGEKELLASCYRESLRLAASYGCGTVAFPLISAGAYGYPQDQALKVATETILDYLADHDLYVYLVVFGHGAWLISRKLYANIQAYIDDSYIGPAYEREESRRRRIQALHYMGNAAREDTEARNRRDPDACMPQEYALTEGAFQDAKASAQQPGLEDMLTHMDEGFRGMLLRKIDEKRITDAECYKKANVDRKLFNKIKNQPGYKPGKSTVLALAIALELPEREIREMLAKAGFALTRSDKFDVIVEYFIEHGNYNIFEINEALFSFDQKLLGSVTP